MTDRPGTATVTTTDGTTLRLFDVESHEERYQDLAETLTEDIVPVIEHRSWRVTAMLREELGLSSKVLDGAPVTITYPNGATGHALLRLATPTKTGHPVELTGIGRAPWR